MASVLQYVLICCTISLQLYEVTAQERKLIIQCINGNENIETHLTCQEGSIFVYNADVRRATLSKTDCSQPFTLATEPSTKDSDRCDTEELTETNKLTYKIRQDCNTKQECYYNFINNCTWTTQHPTRNQTYLKVDYICFKESSIKRIKLDSFWDTAPEFIIESSKYPKEFEDIANYTCNVKATNANPNIEISLEILDFSHNGNFTQVKGSCSGYYTVKLGNVSCDDAERGGPTWTLPGLGEGTVTQESTVSFRTNSSLSNPEYNRVIYFMHLRGRLPGGTSYDQNITVRCGQVPSTTTTKTTATTTTTTTTSTKTTTISSTTIKPSTTNVSTSTYPNATSVASPEENHLHNKGVNIVAVVVGAVGGLVLVMVLIIIVVCVAKRKRRQSDVDTAQKETQDDQMYTLPMDMVRKKNKGVKPDDEEDGEDGENVAYELYSEDPVAKAAKYKKKNKPKPPSQDAKNPALSDLASANRIYANDEGNVNAAVIPIIHPSPSTVNLISPVSPEASGSAASSMSKAPYRGRSASVPDPVYQNTATVTPSSSVKKSSLPSMTLLKRDLAQVFRQRGISASDDNTESVKF